MSRKHPNGPRRAKEPAPNDVANASGESGGDAPFFIVGIGASAGGLEAFTELLKHLPVDTGFVFVLVQHLDPLHESALTQLLSRATSLPVREVTNDLSVTPNHVYIIPPNANLSIARGVLKLEPRVKSSPNRSIDFFFESLARDQRDRAIGVILSGTASDGTIGLEAIKAEGGITFAQDDSARYDSMPHSAVAAGCVDLVLPPKEIAKELGRIAKHPYVTDDPTELARFADEDREAVAAHEDDDAPLSSRGSASPPTDVKNAGAEAPRGEIRAPTGAPNGFKKVLLLLRNHAAVDFSLYKSSTIQRRIARRLVLNKHKTLESYAEFLRNNANELDALYSDLLISVTSFFRNPEAFDVLQSKIFPKLLEEGGDDPIRVWVLGCSTGQEAYSMAMVFVQAAEKAQRMRKLQVFATDLNDALLEKARHGLYAKTVVNDISPERLRRFFVEEEGGYRVAKPLREMVVFARQNVIADAPFSRMDLISCRNLLIYLETGLQQKVIPVFHYALKPHGVLFLGASESIGAFSDLFEPLDKKHRIFAKKAAPTPAFRLPVKAQVHQQAGKPRKAGAHQPAAARRDDVGDAFHAELNAQREADRVTVNQFAPPGVLVNADLQILQFRGATAAFLKPPTGRASFDVLKMAREGLMLPLRAAINKAKKENKTARKENVRIADDGSSSSINIEVIPLKNLRERCYLILFEDTQRAAHLTPGTGSPSGTREALTARPRTRSAGREESRRVAELAADLAETRDFLQSIQEQHEAANEELQASSEEVQSANEELQSVNEELETSKEELESTNEELTTVNEEMVNRNAELNRLNSDLLNVQSSSKLAIVLVRRDLAIRRFSAQAEKQFNLLASDVGRPIGKIRHDLGVPDLEALVSDVIDTVQPRDREVQDSNGRWFSVRVRPYMTLDNKVDGAVLVLVDIGDLKLSEHAIAAARDVARNTIDTVREPLVVLDSDLCVESANPSFYRTFGVAPAQTVGRSIFELGNKQWDIPSLRELLQEILPRNASIEDYRVDHTFPDIGQRSILLNARRILNPQQATERILLAIEDVSDRLKAQDALVASNAQLEAHTDELTQFNSAAVGRELRMIELKNEINELCERLGEEARYPLELEQETQDSAP